MVNAVGCRTVGDAAALEGPLEAEGVQVGLLDFNKLGLNRNLARSLVDFLKECLGLVVDVHLGRGA